MGIVQFLGSASGRRMLGIVGLALVCATIVPGRWWLILAAASFAFFVVGAKDIFLLVPLAGKFLSDRTQRVSCGV